MLCFLKYGQQRSNFLSFWIIFYPENQNFGKMKKTPGDLILDKFIKSHNHAILFLRSGTWQMQRLFFITAPKIKILKKWKNKNTQTSSFCTCVPTIEILCATDGQSAGRMDGQMEKMTYRGGCPIQKWKKKCFSWIVSTLWNKQHLETHDSKTEIKLEKSRKNTFLDYTFLELMQYYEIFEKLTGTT